MKKVISYLFCLIMMFAFASCGKDAMIGMDKAKDKVASDIGAVVDDVEFAVNELVNDDDGDYYYLKFKKDGKLYTYKVDALSGDIIEKNSDDDIQDNTDENTLASNQAEDGDSIIEEDTSELQTSTTK